MAGDIVPIELGLTDGDLVTLWAPEWREGDDEWEAFLGRDEDLFGFESVAELVAFIRTEKEHDLDEHPSWSVFAALSADEFEPDDEHSYDLIGVPEMAAGDPSPEIVAELEGCLSIVRSIGEVCELDVVTRFFHANPVLGAVSSGMSTFYGKDGEALWTDIGLAVAKGWDAVLDAVDHIITTPDVDQAAVAVAEAELLAAAENEVDTDDVDEADEDLDLLDEDESGPTDSDEDGDDESFWSEVGIDPVRIITRDGTYYSLRCYLDDAPVFLGRGGLISVFASERALARYLADAHDHDLAQVSTYEDIVHAATDGSLEIEVTEENVYVLPGLAEDIAEGPAAIDAEQLELAVELVSDAADWADDDSVKSALVTSNPLGWLFSFVLRPDPTRLAPSAPFDAEADAWRALEHGFEARLRKH
ncbi:primosomal protein [Rhodococcus sp. D2-41]|uniref:primosomal protein n=1 Tax=Speluncibacter jeojiensis TaxID=2710754 RepID=UPI00240EBC81|nr:primosomal protein [Rhodococcus sp. D2-41]MDG3008866.1 primosomal protein [Rhodococcus sp. D2-41]